MGKTVIAMSDRRESNGFTPILIIVIITLLTFVAYIAIRKNSYVPHSPPSVSSPTPETIIFTPAADWKTFTTNEYVNVPSYFLKNHPELKKTRLQLQYPPGWELTILDKKDEPKGQHLVDTGQARLNFWLTKYDKNFPKENACGRLGPCYGSASIDFELKIYKNDPLLTDSIGLLGKRIEKYVTQKTINEIPVLFVKYPTYPPNKEPLDAYAFEDIAAVYKIRPSIFLILKSEGLNFFLVGDFRDYANSPEDKLYYKNTIAEINQIFQTIRLVE